MVSFNIIWLISIYRHYFFGFVFEHFFLWISVAYI